MESDGQGRSGTLTLENLARLGRSMIRVVKAAAVSGPYGAAAEAAKEALPFLVKFTIGVIVAILLLLFAVVTAIPSIFFGYEHATSTSVADMTAQARDLGGVYVTLEDFVTTQVDAVVTQLVEEYVEGGIEIDQVEVEYSFTRDDLAWLIAVHSVSCQQDLNLMTPELARSYAVGLTYDYSLFVGEETTLRVTFEKLEPEKLMTEMGFERESKNWAQTLYESLVESDALTDYVLYFETDLLSREGTTVASTYVINYSEE